MPPPALSMLVWQDVSLQQEAIAAAKEMLGMDRGQRFAFCVWWSPRVGMKANMP